MSQKNQLPIVIEIEKEEAIIFDKQIRKYREKLIRPSQEIVDSICLKNAEILKSIVDYKVISKVISKLRIDVWEEFLKDEVEFNAAVMKDLHNVLKTPKKILDVLIENKITDKDGEELLISIKELCGEYAGRVFPYLYKLSLSNTQSRRSRSGKTFEAIIYKIYEVLEYKFDSQGKVGRKIFDEVGLGKKVDSILPGIEEFNQRRNKTIIGTMKTSLRERWQEVAEEIERTKIPTIHLLTVDENISLSKAEEMGKHNIIVVAYSWIAESEKLKSAKNIISFEEYLFEELPIIFDFWES